jgi:hypothetical protein
MRLTRTLNAGYDNLYLNKDDVDRLLKGQMIKESSLIVQMEKPEREWVGLTDEEQQQTYEQWQNDGWGVFYNAIEAKLKEKNNA